VLVAAVAGLALAAPPALAGGSAAARSKGRARHHARCVTLRCAAARAGIRVGVGREAGDPAADAVAAREFDATTTEGSLVWDVVEPAPGRFDFSGADRSIAFARRHRMRLTAAHFVWDQILYHSTPAWVEAIDDPGALRAAMRRHMEAIAGRYGRWIARWIAVNEPLRYVGDTGAIQDNHFSRVLGPHWIDETFRIAHRAAPRSELWLNEIFTETDPRKADALVALARGLVARRVPVDGVSLQGHLFTSLLQPVAPNVPLVRRTLRRLAALGLKVAFTEVDAPIPPGPGRDAEQSRRLGALVGLCLEVRRCTDVTFWNLDDRHSWLRSLFGRDDLAPTLFDGALRPKPAYYAVRTALLAARRRTHANRRHGR